MLGDAGNTENMAAIMRGRARALQRREIRAMEHLGPAGCVVVLGDAGNTQNMAAIMAASRLVERDRQGAKRKLFGGKNTIRPLIRALAVAPGDTAAADNLRDEYYKRPRL
jgi:hypothetical protein